MQTEGSSVGQSFAVPAGNGTYNITTYQYDAHYGDCYPMLFLPRLPADSCVPLSGWFAPYAKLVC